MTEDKARIHLNVDNIVLDLITDYHDVSHSEVVSYFNDLVNNTIKYEGNIANDHKYPKLLGTGRGNKTFWKTVKVVPPVNPPPVLQLPTYPWQVQARTQEHNHVWVVRGFYPETKIPFKLSVVWNKQFDGKELFTKVTLGDKTKTTRFNPTDINKFTSEMADAILLDKDVKSLEPVPYNRKTFRCMKPKGMELLKKAK